MGNELKVGGMVMSLVDKKVGEVRDDGFSNSSGISGGK